MKLSQLIKYNMKNIFLEELYTKHDEIPGPTLFYKKSKFVFIVYLNRWLPKYIKTKILITCLYIN